MPADTVIARSWWTRGRPFTLAELVADGVVHGIGIAMTLVLGALLLRWAGPTASLAEMVALVTYLTTLLAVLAISMAFNLCPITSRWKRPLARLDQAAIFLLIAGTYSPFLVFLGPTPLNIGLGDRDLGGGADRGGAEADRSAPVRARGDGALSGDRLERRADPARRSPCTCRRWRCGC